MVLSLKRDPILMRSPCLIDPIKLTFDARVYQKSIDFVIENEVLRQIDKSNTNHIGYFHQNIFRYMGNGQGERT